MKRQHVALTAALLAMGTWAAPAAADKQYDYSGQQGRQGAQRQDSTQRMQSRQNQSGQQARSQRQSAQARQGRKTVATVSGRLVGLREARLRGEQQPHVLAKLQTSNGKTVVVDLGTRQDLRQMRLARNQPLSVMGPAGRINGKPVIVADKVRDDSRQNAPTLTIVRIIPIEVSRQRQAQARAREQSGQQQGQAQARAMSPRQGSARSGGANLPEWHPEINRQSQSQTRLINGRVIDRRELAVRSGSQSQGQKHLLVKIQTPRGRTALLDLGKADAQALKDVNLNRGEFISAVGRMGRINGRPMLVADHVAEIVTIDRDRDNPGQSGEATQAGARQQRQSSPEASSQSQGASQSQGGSQSQGASSSSGSTSQQSN